MTPSPMPMFPLGSVLVPSQVLPLHIFEPRYRAMIEDLMAGDQMFGVCLIERGHEVGGEDQRSMAGTVARIIEAEQLDDGRWAVIAVGVHRIVVNRWLPDDPYPRAEVSAWEDEPSPASTQEAFDETMLLHRRVLVLASEAGFDVGPLPDISTELSMGSFQLVATAPISAFDRQRLLSAPSAAERLQLLNDSLEAALELIRFELARGEG